MTGTRKRSGGAKACGADDYVYRSLLYLLKKDEGYREIKTLISKSRRDALLLRMHGRNIS